MRPHRSTIVRLSTLCLLAFFLLSWASSRTWAASPDSVDASTVDLLPAFDEWGVRARPQGTRGTCSVFTVAAAIEYALGRSGRPENCVSVEFLNWASNQSVGEARDGSFFSDLWNGFEKYGACDEELMPYRGEFDPQRSPSEEALVQAKQILENDLTLHWIKPWDPNKGLNDKQLESVKATLRAGWPVCGGFLWPKKAVWSSPEDVKASVTIPRERGSVDPVVPDGSVLQWAPREGVRDGHSVILYGFRDDPDQPGGGVFLIRNSSRGARHGAMTYEYVRAYMNDAVWVESKKP